MSADEGSFPSSYEWKEQNQTLEVLKDVCKDKETSDCLDFQLGQSMINRALREYSSDILYGAQHQLSFAVQIFFRMKVDYCVI